MASHNDLGKWGEDLAVELLLKAGYAIAERNWRLGSYEIDIIAIKDEFVVFVEVKTRSNIDEDPFDAIDRRKISHMAASANAYIQHTDQHRVPRFDVIGVRGTPEAEYAVEHIPDAFWPSLKSYR